MKNKALHMIGHAHIDPVWLWTWQEGFHEVHATFRSALDRLHEYEDFQFVASSAAFYEWVEKSNPAMFEEIRQRVAEQDDAEQAARILQQLRERVGVAGLLLFQPIDVHRLERKERRLDGREDRRGRGEKQKDERDQPEHTSAHRGAPALGASGIKLGL